MSLIGNFNLFSSFSSFSSFNPFIYIYNTCVDLFYHIVYYFKQRHKCDICNERFRHKHNLSSHIRESHSEIFVWGTSKKVKNILETERLI